MLTPKTIIAQGISGSDPYNPLMFLGPQLRDILMTLAISHGFTLHRSNHDEASVDQKRHV